jgi:hypothetical protein
MSLVAEYLRRDHANFSATKQAAMACLPKLVEKWLPHGKRRGHEWVATNPTRSDRRPGSFSVNLKTGMWADFATGDRGGDPISLAAYLFSMSQGEAARMIAIVLGVDWRARA